MVSRRVQNVQLIDITADAIEFPVEILNSWRVLIIKALVQKARDDRRFAHFGRSEHDHAVAVLGWNIEIMLGRRHFLNHDFCRSNAHLVPRKVLNKSTCGASLLFFAEPEKPGRIYINKTATTPPFTSLMTQRSQIYAQPYVLRKIYK